VKREKKHNVELRGHLTAEREVDLDSDSEPFPPLAALDLSFKVSFFRAVSLLNLIFTLILSFILSI
jgi:hypothetical protein